MEGLATALSADVQVQSSGSQIQSKAGANQVNVELSESAVRCESSEVKSPYQVQVQSRASKIKCNCSQV